jgi:uncharacterized protein (TIGR02597 family)
MLKIPSPMSKTRLPSRALLAAIAALGGLATISNAQSVATTPVGAMTVSIQPNAYTFIGPAFYRPAVYQGSVSAISGDGLTISISTSALTAGSANQVTIGSEQVPQYFVEVLDGTDIGAQIPVISNTANSITLNENASTFLGAGHKFRLIPYHTLSSLFPAGGGLTGGISAASADEIFIYSPTGGAKSYFYRTSSSQWRQGTVDNNLRPILPNQGIYIQRKQSTAVPYTLIGNVKDGTTALDIAVGYNLVPNPYPVPVTLEASGLYTADAATGLKSGLSAANADEITIYQNDGSSLTYFYRNGTGWRNGSTNVTNVPIPAGATVLINRKAGGVPFSWVLAQNWSNN